MSATSSDLAPSYTLPPLGSFARGRSTDLKHTPFLHSVQQSHSCYGTSYAGTQGGNRHQHFSSMLIKDSRPRSTLSSRWPMEGKVWAKSIMWTCKGACIGQFRACAVIEWNRKLNVRMGLWAGQFGKCVFLDC
eukprot:1158659-Pelagomonas_calceolata.AAC.5